jgi:uncharacterized Ntn-hydrolase superfamily protein
MTFSIAGRCSRTGMLGMAIASSSICVASRCCWARPGVGAVLTQNFTDPAIGQRALDLLAEGLSAAQAVRRVVEENPFPAYRQVAAIDSKGEASVHTGERALPICASAVGGNCVTVGNLLTHPDVPREMVTSFEKSPDPSLPVRLLSALEKGLQAGGEVSPVRSAGLLVVDRQPWPLVDLRVDWHDTPLLALRRLWERYEPQMNEFLLWALSPDKASPVSSATPRPASSAR